MRISTVGELLFRERVKLEVAYLLPSHFLWRLTEIFRELCLAKGVAAIEFKLIYNRKTHRV
jgi:hypothetical protein